MKRRRDIRLQAVSVTLATIGMAGIVLTLLPGSGVELPDKPSPAYEESAGTKQLPHTRATRAYEIEKYFQQGVMMLHAGRYYEAATAFEQVLERDPKISDARVNMGFALFGQGRHALAGEYFRSAIDLIPHQVNAYYGLAMALEVDCDLAGAKGAMRTFLHLMPVEDKYTRKAQSALWEWESRKPDKECNRIDASSAIALERQ